MRSSQDKQHTVKMGSFDGITGRNHPVPPFSFPFYGPLTQVIPTVVSHRTGLFIWGRRNEVIGRGSPGTISLLHTASKLTGKRFRTIAQFALSLSLSSRNKRFFFKKERKKIHSRINNLRCTLITIWKLEVHCRCEGVWQLGGNFVCKREKQERF